MNGMPNGSRTWTSRAAAAMAIVAAGFSGASRGGEPVSITRLYGAGVHAYFSGDYLRSYDDLTESIESGSRDPRSRYFRGLAALSLGRLDEAEADFSSGALLEAEAGGDWPVSRSLERVQGHQRIQLERHRARARVAALQRARDRELARYGETQAAQPDVQRPRKPAGRPFGTDEPTNPFADEPGAGAPPAKPPVPAEEPPVPAEEMPPPAEPEPAPTIPGNGDDPFGNAPQPEPQLEPQPEMPAEPTDAGAGAGEPAAEEQPVDPGQAPTPEDPFGDATQPQPEVPAEPMAEEPAAPAAGGE